LSGKSNLHNSLWRQGSILPRDLVDPGVLPTDLDPAAKLVIVSHSCDIVHPSYEGEPYVEFFIARPALKAESLKRRGKNPRRLQFLMGDDGTDYVYEISVHDKFRVSRQVLEGKEPDTSRVVPKDDVATIARWAAKRYNRPAFPTEFDRRLSMVGKDKFERAIRRYGDDVSGIFIAFLSSTGELKDTEAYQISVRIVAPQEALANDEREQALLRLKTELENLFGNCAGIQVEGLRLDSETAFSLEDLKNSTVWDYEFVSEEDSEHTYLAGS